MIDSGQTTPNFLYRIDVRILSIILLLLVCYGTAEARLRKKKAKKINNSQLAEIKVGLNLSIDPRFRPYSDSHLKENLNREMDAQEAPGLTYGVFILNALKEEELVNQCSKSYTDFKNESRFFSAMADNLANWQTNIAEGINELTIEALIKAHGGAGISIGTSSLFLAIDLAQISVGIKALDSLFSKRALFYYITDRKEGTSHHSAWGIAPVSIKHRKPEREKYFESLWNKYGKYVSDDGLAAGFRKEQHKKLRSLLFSALPKESSRPIVTPPEETRSKSFSYQSASVECYAKYPDWPISPEVKELKKIIEDLREGRPVQKTKYWSSEDISENQEYLVETYKGIEAGTLVSLTQSGEATITIGIQPEWDIPNIIRQWIRVDNKYGSERMRAMIGTSRILTDETHDEKSIEAIFDKDSLDFKDLFPELDSLKIHVLAKAYDLRSEGYFGIQIAVVEDKWTDYRDVAKNIIDSMKMKVAGGGESETEYALSAMTEKELFLLSAIRICQESYKAENGVYLECKPSPPGGGDDARADSWVDAGGFSDIGFWPDRLVFCQYAVTVSDNGNSFTATASTDLNENGVRVVYAITNNNPKPVKKPQNEY